MLNKICFPNKIGIVLAAASFLFIIVINNDTAWSAIPYTSSSHGQNGIPPNPKGVDRSSIDNRLAAYSTGNCAHCHEQHFSISGKQSNTGSLSKYMVFDVEQDACLTCHRGTPASDIKTEFTIGKGIVQVHGNDGINDFMFDKDNQHTAYEKIAADFGNPNDNSDITARHAECTDCHNPHAATAINVSDSSVGPTVGATGIVPSSRSGNWAVPIFRENLTVFETVNRMEQYTICYKCHSNFAGYGTGSNTAQEFNVDNESFHNVEGADNPPSSDMFGDFNILGNAYAYKMMPRYKNATNATLRNAKLLCTDCHGNSDISVQGIHGSTTFNMLKVPNNSPYDTWDENSDVTDTNIWCFNCHDPNFANSGFSAGGAGSNFHVSNSHGEASNVYCMSCHAAVPHGYKNPRLLVCDDDKDTTDVYIRGTRPGGFLCSEKDNWAVSGGWSRNVCHGTQTSPGVTTCHGI